jgi:hypothetical protein
VINPYVVVLAPGLPVVALGRGLLWDLQIVLELFWALEHVPDETGTQVPCDVAVKGYFFDSQ